MIDQQIRVDQVPRQLRGPLLAGVLPFPSQVVLIRAPRRHTPSQQPSGLGDDTARSSSPSEVSDQLRGSRRPFDRLQLIFQSFELFHDIRVFHSVSPCALSVACPLELVNAGRRRPSMSADLDGQNGATILDLQRLVNILLGV
jgi:hypothetical protein